MMTCIYFDATERVDGESFVGEVGRKTECHRSVLIADHQTAAKCDFGGEPVYFTLPSDAVTWLERSLHGQTHVLLTRGNYKYLFHYRQKEFMSKMYHEIF
jgi:hypothetical protein